jgi:hypothetical protein
VSQPRISVSTENEEAAALRGRDLVEKVIDPEIARFEKWFANQKHAGGGLILMEREVLRAYLYQKLVGTI